MNTRQRTIASVVAAGLILLAGCSIGTYQTYAGKKLPNSQTALIKVGHGAHFLRFVDGMYIPIQTVGDTLVAGALFSWGRESIRVLPGTHDVEVAKSYQPPTQHVIFDAESGETYTVHWDVVEEVDYIWVENKSGSVVVGEKPPAARSPAREAKIDDTDGPTLAISGTGLVARGEVGEVGLGQRKLGATGGEDLELPVVGLYGVVLARETGYAHDKERWRRVSREEPERGEKPDAYVIDVVAQVVGELPLRVRSDGKRVILVTEILRLVEYQIESTEPVGGGKDELNLTVWQRLAG